MAYDKKNGKDNAIGTIRRTNSKEIISDALIKYPAHIANIDVKAYPVPRTNKALVPG
jgi:hypothetical protein